MSLSKKEILAIANTLPNPLYRNNLQATKQLVELFDTISQKPLQTVNDYATMYEDNFYTYSSWTDLVESEEALPNGLTEDELTEELGSDNGSVWQLPCGLYVQYV